LLIGMLAADDSVSFAHTVKADQVVVVKSQRTLTLLSQGKVIHTYKVALGGTPVGAKEQQGDHKTPEGHYVLDRRNSKSRFYKSIHVSYPNEQDQQKAAKNGTSPGGDIMIHGLPNGQGGGYLDVDLSGLGAANAYFNTNTFAVTGIDANGDPVDNGLADIRLHSSFAKDASGSTFPLSGSADLSEFSTPKRVPEPGSLILLGTGLLGLAGLRRKRVKA